MVTYIKTMDEFNAMLETSKSKAVVLDFTATWWVALLSPMDKGMDAANSDSLFFRWTAGVHHVEWSVSESNEVRLRLIETAFSRSIIFCSFYSGPIFEAMAGEFPGVDFFKVDVDEAEDVAAACGIQAMPTFQVFKDGAKVDEMKGADQAGLKALVTKHQ